VRNSAGHEGNLAEKHRQTGRGILDFSVSRNRSRKVVIHYRRRGQRRDNIENLFRSY